jgi:hypothetical protein
MSRLLKTLPLVLLALTFSASGTETQSPRGTLDPSRASAPSEQRIPRGYLFLSSNTEENLALDEASLRLDSERQKRFRRVAGEILAKIDLPRHQVLNALGDWSDGVENGLLVEVSGTPDFAGLRYAAAWFGSLADQKSVLFFRADDQGGDGVYQLEVPRAHTPQLRKVLDEHGVRFRTLVPLGKGQRVVVFDEGRQLRANIARLAAFYGVRLSETRGTGAFLGGESRAAAQRTFRQVIGDYQRCAALIGSSPVSFPRAPSSFSKPLFRNRHARSLFHSYEMDYD